MDISIAHQKVCDGVQRMLGEPVQVAVFAHKGPKKAGNGVRRVFGAKDPAARMRVNNLLVLTPGHVRLVALGGRSGLKPKEEIGAWPLGSVRIDSTLEDQHTFFVGSGMSMDQQVFRLHLHGDGQELVMHVMANAGLDVGDLAALEGSDDPDVQEGAAGLAESAAETEQGVRAIVSATGGSFTTD